jgi:hypothetical protein
MADALLCTDGNNALRFRIELNIKTPAIKVGHGQTKFINAFGGRVSMVPWILNRFDQFLNNMFGSGEIRIPHAQVDDILPSLSGLYLQLIHNAENIRRQPHHPMKSGTFGVKRIHISFSQKTCKNRKRSVGIRACQRAGIANGSVRPQ